MSEKSIKCPLCGYQVYEDENPKGEYKRILNKIKKYK